jgi:L-rhamnose isomerase/sugar isomerase
MDAFHTDVRSDLADCRVTIGLPADPMAAFAESGYMKEIVESRKGGQQAGWT